MLTDRDGNKTGFFICDREDLTEAQIQHALDAVEKLCRKWFPAATEEKTK